MDDAMRARISKLQAEQAARSPLERQLFDLSCGGSMSDYVRSMLRFLAWQVGETERERDELVRAVAEWARGLNGIRHTCDEPLRRLAAKYGSQPPPGKTETRSEPAAPERV